MIRLSPSLVLLGALWLLVTSACSGDFAQTATSALDGTGGKGARGHKSAACADLGTRVKACFEDNCAQQIASIEACVDQAALACEPLWQAAKACEQSGGPCDAELDAAKTCKENVKTACEPEHQALEACAAPCDGLVAQMKASCRAGKGKGKGKGKQCSKEDDEHWCEQTCGAEIAAMKGCFEQAALPCEALWDAAKQCKESGARCERVEDRLRRRRAHRRG